MPRAWTAFSASLLSAMMLDASSALADTLCPKGYRESRRAIAITRYVTFKGRIRECATTTNFGSLYFKDTPPGADCGDGIKAGSDWLAAQRGGDMYVYVPSQDGTLVEFFGNDSLSPKVTVSCESDYSHCSEKEVITNNAKSDYADFSIPITSVTETHTWCQKVSF